MSAANPASDQTLVSVIVPARNEEASLGRCLTSLTGQTGVRTEIIVVDDGSTDATRSIARGFPEVRMATPGTLPAGWSGKNNALVAGVAIAQGTWFLFTDADTFHRPGSLAKSLAEARSHGAQMLSYSPEQEVHSLWEKAVMPVVFAELATSFNPKAVSDPTSTVAAANGQYLLVSREAYEAVGGHSAVAHSLLEDVALARAVKASGRRIFFRYGGDAVSARMYRSFEQLVEGWTKNLVTLFPSPAKLAAKRLAEWAVLSASALTFLWMVASGRRRGAVIAVVAFGAVSGFTLRRIRRAHFSWDANLLAYFGLPIFSYLLLRSKLSYKRGSVSWKGRSYDPLGATSRGVAVLAEKESLLPQNRKVLSPQ